MSQLPDPGFPFDEGKFIEALGITSTNVLAGTVKVERYSDTVCIRYECFETRTPDEVEAALNEAGRIGRNRR